MEVSYGRKLITYLSLWTARCKGDHIEVQGLREIKGFWLPDTVLECPDSQQPTEKQAPSWSPPRLFIFQ